MYEPTTAMIAGYLVIVLFATIGAITATRWVIRTLADMSRTYQVGKRTLDKVATPVDTW